MTDQQIHRAHYEPFFIYLNDIPCRIEPSEAQTVDHHSCMIVPKQFLGDNVSGEILLRDVTNSLDEHSQQNSISQEVLRRVAQEHGYLLLPEPVTGLVRVERFHRYQTVRFVGEHLLLTGSFAEHPVVAPSMSMADADLVNSLSTEKDTKPPYSNTLANEMLGFALYVRERARGVGSIVRVTSEWHMLPNDVKLRYCNEAAGTLEAQVHEGNA